MTTRNVLDRPLRVVHATECAAAGTLTVIIALAHELASTGAKQTLLYSRRAETPDDLAGLFPASVELVELPAASGLHVAFIRDFSRALRRVVTEWMPDVVHLHSSKAGFVGRFALATERTGFDIFYSPHGLSFLDPDRPLRNAVFKALEYVAAKTRAMPVACGDSEAQMLSALSGRRATVLENPVDDLFFAVRGEPAVVPVVVSVGRLSRQKSPDRFAEIARTVRALRPDIRFVWIGDGDAHYRKTLIESGCELMGWRSQSEVAAFLANATVYLQTSLWEGLPVSVIQALAAGVPCVVHDCAGNRDAVTQGTTGFIAASVEELAMRVMSLVGDPAMRDLMGNNARRDASRRFGRAVFSRRVRQIYAVSTRDAVIDPAALEVCDRAVTG